MASTNEKPKKGFMSLYKTASASPRHKFQLPESKPVTNTKNPNNNNNNNSKNTNETSKLSYNVSRSWFLRKLPTKPAVIRSSQDQYDHHQQVVEESEKSAENNGDIINNGKVVEGRKSVSHVESNLGSVISFLQVKVLVSDMPNYMQVHAFRCARRTHDSLDKFSSKHMAYNIKKEFDKVHGPAWHCIVGSSFGSFVTHSTGCFLYFSMDKLYILLFKTKIQKAKD